MRNETMTVGELYSKVNDGVIKSDIDVQREIVYDTTKQMLVIDSLVLGVPLPAFYFWETGGVLETLDGKQRIHAITRFLQNDLKYNDKIWLETDPEVQKKIKEVELTCIICSGEESLKREIFRRINTLGVPLSPFEVLNGLFAGQYLRGITQYVLSDKGAIKVLGDASRGRRQMRLLKYLMIVNNKKAADINDWVAEHKDDSFAADQRVIDKYIDFIADIFDDMALADVYFSLSLKYLTSKSLWVKHKKEINKTIRAYKKSDDWKLTKDKPGDIEAFINGITGGTVLDPRRLFTASQKQELLDRTDEKNGRYPCAICRQYFYPDELQADHIKPWSKGGRTEISNGRILCRVCNTTIGASNN